LWISLILISFKLGSKILMHARWMCDEDYCTKAKFYHKIQFRCKSNANVIIPNRSVKPNDIFSLVHKYIQSSNCDMSLSDIKPILTTSFTCEILNYFNSPEITFFPVVEIQLFSSRSLPLVSTYVGRDWLGCTNITV
jgi:hypothetical protein